MLPKVGVLSNLCSVSQILSPANTFKHLLHVSHLTYHSCISCKATLSREDEYLFRCHSSRNKRKVRRSVRCLKDYLLTYPRLKYLRALSWTLQSIPIVSKTFINLNCMAESWFVHYTINVSNFYLSDKVSRFPVPKPNVSFDYSLWKQICAHLISNIKSLMHCSAYILMLIHKR